jgi:hypothetical protein
MGLLSGSGSAAFKSVDRTNFTATAGQTTFTLTQGYSVGDIDVYLNGVRLFDGDDYYALNGSTVVLSSAAVAGDVLQVVSYNQFLSANTYSKSEADSRYMVASGQNPMTSYLRTPNYGISSYSDSANASLEASVGSGESGVGVKAFGRSVATNGGDILYTTDTRGAGGRHRFGYWNGSSFTSTLTIDSSGRVTTSQQPFSFYDTCNSTTNTSGNAIPKYTRKISGRGTDGYSTSTGYYTAPVSGVYMFSWVYLMQSIDTGIQVDDGYLVNGTFFFGGNRRVASSPMTFGDNYMAVKNSVVIYLNANEYFCPRSQHSDTSWNFYGGATWGHFQAALIG